MKDPVIRFRIDFSQNDHLGPGKIALLEAVQETGSISDAARALRMSYRRAWLLVNSLNSTFSEPVAISSTGGKGGGGAQVTPFGARLVGLYRALEDEIAQLGRERLAEILPVVVRGLASHAITSGKPLKKKVASPPRKS